MCIFLYTSVHIKTLLIDNVYQSQCVYLFERVCDFISFIFGEARPNNSLLILSSVAFCYFHSFSSDNTHNIE